jgi:anaerobic magnesium-protoporphyrin IX monomethyl ester cyclase
MKIVLIRPFYNSYIITPPLGLGYLSSILKQNGIQTVIIDALMLGLSQNELIAAIKKEKPDAVAITCLTAFSREVVSLSRSLKALSMRVIIGGVHPTFLPFGTLFDSGCDFVICGEGEVPLLRLIKNNFNPKGIKGVYHQNNLKSENKKTEFAEIVENIDDLPFPDWEQMDPRKYAKAPHGLLVRHFPIGVIIATRGCPYECTFCSSPNFCKRHIRFRSPENIVDEIEYLVKTFKVREIHFEDDNLTLKRNHTEKLCRLIIEKGLKISWACPNGIRADKVDKELVKLMKQSGCYYFSFGIESASLEILKNIKKKISLDVIEKSINIANREGISTQGFFVFGLPGETRETIEQTIQFAGKTKLSRAQFAILDILPGSELWDALKGKFEPNWEKNSYKEPEWIPEGLTKQDLLDAQSRAMRKFYFRPRIFFRLIRHLRINQVFILLKRLKEQRVFKIGKSEKVS